MNLEEMEKTIKELKELHTHQAENDQIIHVEIYEMINSNKEVLRKLMEALGNLNMDVLKLDEFILILKKLLEKLDARQTEIKICPKCHAYYKGIHTEDACNYHSGTEEDCSKCELRNTRECAACLQIKGSPYNKFKEKPPEPKYPFCGRNLICYKETWICGHGCTKPAVKPDEPREDDPTKKKPLKIDINGIRLGKLIVVKREKIEFWRKELLNKTDEVLKSMREVLGIK